MLDQHAAPGDAGGEKLASQHLERRQERHRGEGGDRKEILAPREDRRPGSAARLPPGDHCRPSRWASMTWPRRYSSRSRTAASKYSAGTNFPRMAG
jgi:hypothetical protein